MKEFKSYISYLKTLINGSPVQYGELERGKRIINALDGEPNKAIHRLISHDDLRKSGVFFTGAELANRALDPEFLTFDDTSIIFDPACGIGDLLISCARKFPLAPTLKKTLHNWGKQLYGSDLYPEFTQTVKYRLALLAINRGFETCKISIQDIEKAFFGIRPENGLRLLSDYQNASHIVVNPPYTIINAPSKCSWASGNVTMAAVFMDACIKNSLPNTKISAILPDVLRSGSRYLKWRKNIEKISKIDKIEIVGKFDRWTDVDVFILHLTVDCTSTNHKGDWWAFTLPSPTKRVEDFFEVFVGPVVPHRDPNEGAWHPYIHTRIVPVGEIMNHIEKKRRYSGRVFPPPFVVVRRTSSPGDKNRCLGTIINEKRTVAVENHLLVLVPRDKTLKRCQELLTILRSYKSNEWLNERIRCRHLTVLALRDLPWFIESEKNETILGRNIDGY